MQQPENKAPAAQEIFNRPPRIWPSFPHGKVIIPQPPKRENLPSKPPGITLVMPVIMVGLMLCLYLFVVKSSPQTMVFLLPMALFSIMTPITAVITSRQNIRKVKQQLRKNEKDYREIIDGVRSDLTGKVDALRRLALLKDPDPTDLESVIKERTNLWERRPEDPDFLAVRVGSGTLPFTVEIQIPEVDITDPMLPEVQRFQQEFVTVTGVPNCVSLPTVKSMGITGPRQIVADFARGLLCQIAALHSPEDVRIVGLFPSSQQQDWEWLREIPHTLPLKQSKQSKVERLFAAGQDQADLVLNLLLEELSQRATKESEGQTGQAMTATNKGAETLPLPHIVVIVHDYIEARKHPALSNAFKLGEQLGVSVIYLVAQESAIPSECRGVVRILDAECLTYAAAGYAGETLEHVRPDIMEVAMARRIAKALAPLHIAIEGVDAVDLPTNVRLLDLLGIAYADQFNVEQWWTQGANGGQPPFGRLRIPMGIGLKGTVWIDFSDNVHGPHGIIAGTTGAGKSELLSSLIIGLAVTHHPHLVNFVLVDFKGGAAFKPFEKMPHTVGLVSDLSGNLTERALHALKSELRRREHILGEANVKKIAQYQALHAQSPSLFPPLPNLFIIIDEFAELAKEHPSFMDGLVSVVQKGRSLGVHLILATQKPTGSVNASIWSNLKFRICLRVASVQDSRDMLGRSEAGLLPISAPGRAYFQVGAEIFELFQSARISQPARVMDESLLVVKPGGEEITDQRVLVSAMEQYTAEMQRELFRPWPDPLPRAISLQELAQRQDLPAPIDVGMLETPKYGWLTVPTGLADLPIEQRQEPLLLNLPHQGGHVLIAGASGSGKSVFLRTLILSLAQTHTPAQLHMYLIDYGGQALRVFEQLPHVGGIFGESHSEYIRRLLRKLDGIIEERKEICRTQQIDDFLAYQRRRLENPSLPEMPAVLLIIDKFIEFKLAHEKDLDLLLSIVRFGRSYGVFLVISADRPVAVPPQMMSLIDIRFGLRLVELTDSLILLGKNDAAHLDPGQPGRAYRRGKTLDEVHFALPTDGEDDDEQTRLLDEAVLQLTKEYEGSAAPPIRLLPEYVRVDDFLIEAAFSAANTPTGIIRMRVGIEDISLRPITLELNLDTPHALVAGGSGSGRTGVLQTALLALAGTPGYESMRVILVDFRRTSRPMRRLSYIWAYADTEERLVAAIEQLKTELQARSSSLREALEQDSDELAGTHMTPILLVIDDFDQLLALMKNPLNDLKEFWLQARDLGLHILIAGSSGDLGRSDPLLTQVRAGRLGIVLGGDPNDSPMLGVRMSDMLAGRGYLVRRNMRYLVQFAHTPVEMLPTWVNRFVQVAEARNTLLTPAHYCPWCPVEPESDDEVVESDDSDDPTPEEVRAAAEVQ